ncbi:hypothetical protein C2G38_2168100 [Gigaspora rosea]|uniref:Uncharacterized protein n=1 Tax=Gigaspora rosea TaxID=44941 RepID=A0A397VS99_9GLOM|nr:hypothetical protein C2G38_2168100 [Gigaspora rosea]
MGGRRKGLENTLIRVDMILQSLLYQYSTSFGGPYIDLKSELIIVQTLDPEMIEKIRFSHFRINDISLNIYIYTDMEANNNVILVPVNSSSNMEFIDTIKDYDADVIFAQTGNPLNLDIYKRQDEDKLNNSFYRYPWNADKPLEDLRASFIGTLVYFSKEPHDFDLIKATGKNIKLSPIIMNIDYKEYPELLIYDK